MDDWTSYLPKNGFKGSISSLPNATMELDNTIEDGGLQSSALFGQTRNMVDIGATKSGGGYVRLDSSNKRIVINDGENDRVLIGYQSGGF